ncbi:DUF4019 domain-containing protein [Lysobacter sp. K5869]|uniref:DUF4019 domain-containing protein n=1 Tax=Lysobacter sp. K5869 TaxID=2820808 RepID=UPI001C062CCA|nr:DUF4019 domain-containing protein [Lysobacter sp. K5869]QWP75875.1 DUF4019 domain-containing protein [Lysobacter sp. K5869]
MEETVRNRFARIALATLAAAMLAATLPACKVQVGPSQKKQAEAVNIGTEAEQRELLRAAEAVAKDLDAGRYAAAWAKSSPTLSKQTNQEQFTKIISRMRGAVGAPGKRKVKGFGFESELDGLAGRFGTIAIGTEFARLKTGEEKFVFEHVDGKWKLVGYFLSGKVKFPAD